MPGFLTNWLFLAVLSAFATAALIIASWEAFGTIHSSLIMALRVAGVIAIVGPIAVYVLWAGTSGLSSQTISTKTILIWLGIAVSAGVSWFSFYLALEYGKLANVSAAAITAINYASVIVVLLASWLLGRQQVSTANIAGVLLVVAGCYLVNIKPAGEASQHAIGKVE